MNAAEKAGRWVQGSSAQTDELAGEEDVADMLEVMAHLHYWIQSPISIPIHGVFTLSGTGTEAGTVTGTRQWGTIGLVLCPGSCVM